MCMVVAHIQISKNEGFLLAVYHDSSKEGIFGVSIKPNELEQALEEGIRYQICLDSIVKVEEIEPDNTPREEGVMTIDPFDDGQEPFGDEDDP